MSARGAVNGWRCKRCGAITYAVHIDEGVTPMFLTCRAAPGCGGRGVSLMYPDMATMPQHVADTVAWEWYKPNRRATRRLDPDLRQHVEKGGLLLRPLSDAGRSLLPKIKALVGDMTAKPPIPITELREAGR